MMWSKLRDYEIYFASEIRNNAKCIENRRNIRKRKTPIRINYQQ
jgi:hypothetical protein